MILFTLFLTFAQIGLFSFGGGYAILRMMEQQMVIAHGWLTQTEFMDVLAISQITPGPIAINAATFTGLRMAGVLGAAVSTTGVVAPSCVIVLVLAYFFYKYQDLGVMKGILWGIRPASVAMIAAAAVSIVIDALQADSGLDIPAIAVFGAGLAALCILRAKKLNPIWVMLACAGIGIGAAALGFV